MQADFQILLIELLSYRTKQTDWNTKIFYMDKATLDEQRRLYNLSAMYLTQQDSAKRLIRVQKKLQIRGYHIAEKGIFQTIICYLVNEEFQFLERVNEILHWIRSSGLYDLWYRQEDILREKIILKKNVKCLVVIDESNDNSFSMPMFLVYGWFASTILLFVEMIWFKFSGTVADAFERFQRIFIEKFICC